jgi:hypothetical protein
MLPVFRALFPVKIYVPASLRLGCHVERHSQGKYLYCLCNIADTVTMPPSIPSLFVFLLSLRRVKICLSRLEGGSEEIPTTAKNMVFFSYSCFMEDISNI